MDIKTLKDNIKKLRDSKADIISVANSEWYSLFKDEIRNSIAIEGVFANRSDLLDVLDKNKRSDKQKTAAILGYYEAAVSIYEYANNQYKEEEFQLKISDIKQIHTMLMRYEKEVGTFTGHCGEFRRGNVEVAEATFKPVDVFYVKDALSLMVKWANAKLKDEKLDPIYIAAVVHIWFETIHPFRDGNGRVGRILMSYLLIGMGLLNITIKGVAKRDREAYYNALEVCDECFEGLHNQVEQGEKFNVKEIDRLLKEMDFTLFEKMISKALKSSTERVSVGNADELSGDTILPLSKIAEFFDYSPDYLRNLINRKNLRAHKKGKLWYVYIKDMRSYLRHL